MILSKLILLVTLLPLTISEPTPADQKVNEEVIEPKVFDCFFFNKDADYDVISLKINTMHSYVDYFVVI